MNATIYHKNQAVGWKRITKTTMLFKTAKFLGYVMDFKDGIQRVRVRFDDECVSNIVLESEIFKKEE